MKQETALSILKMGANAFVTGEPGSGKTHTVNRYVEWLRSRGIEPAITASTGIAATHIGGQTLHSWSGIGIRKTLDAQELAALGRNDRLAKRVQNAHVLIIDEISMLDAVTLDTVEAVCRTLRKSDKAFGGLQIVLVGDFFQLPPVSREGEPPSRFAFEAEAWRRADLEVCYLSEQHRQEDAVFLSMLAEVRRGRPGGGVIATLSARMNIVYDGGANGQNTTKLFSHNEDVDRINNEHLAKLPGEARTYAMERRGPKNLTDQLVRGCLSPETLTLKVGAEVMCTKNDLERKYVNGTLGRIVAFDKESGLPVMQTRGGRTLLMEPDEWSIMEHGVVRAKIVQIPLRLAWAITVHKSQGMSLDAAAVDLSKAFEYGQGYVALSRVRTLAGLFLLGLNERALAVHPAILARDAAMRELSQKTEQEFAAVPAEERTRREHAFILACGGKVRQASEAHKPAGAETYADRLERVREKYPNAYRPWSKEDDALLAAEFQKGTSTKDLSNLFKRQPGAVRSRLVKLGLVE